MFNYQHVLLISVYSHTHQKTTFADAGPVGILIFFFRREKNFPFFGYDFTPYCGDCTRIALGQEGTCLQFPQGPSAWMMALMSELSVRGEYYVYALKAEPALQTEVL